MDHSSNQIVKNGSKQPNFQEKNYERKVVCEINLFQVVWTDSQKKSRKTEEIGG